jgi:hypothetical protein
MSPAFPPEPFQKTYELPKRDTIFLEKKRARRIDGMAMM